ncbi:Glycoside hydrolase [Operophtera brumata]|uniref:Glycoside hydrolase n=1 Tax=Operophtera brumata TaxID=104452 RepID=A0A0L7K553_OPEBR|nr:Glycoside hydrolase [Operophtera brumata]
MIKFLGVHFYRFSISWPRLFPNGFTNKISEDGRRYYDNLIDELLANGIDPIVTMYHWDLPQSLQDLGGWANPLIADWFEDYARTMFSLFGDRVKTWVTLNEPKQIGIFGYGMTRFAPGLDMAGIADYLAVKNIGDSYLSFSGKCGITIAVDFREGASDAPEDIEAGLYAMDFEVGLYSHPIFSSKGGFPERAIKRVLERSTEQGFIRSRLPELSDEEIEYIKGTSDFFGMNHYSTRFYTPYTPGSYEVPSYNDDVGGDSSYLDYAPALLLHSTNCNDPPIMITENGFSTLSGLDDEERVEYFRRYLSNVLDAIADGTLSGLDDGGASGVGTSDGT